MSTAAQKKAAKRANRSIYSTFIPAMLIDEDGQLGETRLGLFATHPIDARLLKERGYKQGDEVRIEIAYANNPKFFRLAHAIGALLKDNVDGFQNGDAHDALKEIQRRANVCCEVQLQDARPVVQGVLAAVEALLGAGARQVLEPALETITTIEVTVAESIAFDEMPPERFRTFFEGLTDYIDNEIAPGLTDDVRAEYHLMVAGENNG